MIVNYNDFLLEAKKNTISNIPIKKEDIIDWLNRNVFKKLSSEEFNINDDNSINILRHFNINVSELTQFPYKFNQIDGFFGCSNNKLNNLINSPDIINGYFNCSKNKITSLIGGPKEVKEFYDCSNNKLTDLEGSPEIVNGLFNCDGNKLKSVKGAPKKIIRTTGNDSHRYDGSFSCTTNRWGKLETLEGGPEYVDGNYTFKKYYEDGCMSKMKLGYDISYYPLCVIGGYISGSELYKDICKLIKENKELFIPLTNNKMKFHKQLLNLDNSLLKYYEKSGFIPIENKKGNILL